ncbi:MAG: hypothetical protein IPJ40_11975 [Saprospirales bacterium]|nr:hypothetical protein [Saprospirales bacterium]
MIYLTALIPIIFWAIHYRWQKHLSMCSARERMMSWFDNSQAFLAWLEGEESGGDFDSTMSLAGCTPTGGTERVRNTWVYRPKKPTCSMHLANSAFRKILFTKTPNGTIR